jgi:LysM repeat protein
MMMLSIGRTAAPAFLVGAASVVAIGYAVTQIPRGDNVESGPLGLMSQPAPAPSKPASAAIAADNSAATSEAPPPLASTATKVAALSADLGISPAAPALDPGVPAFDIARVEAGGDAVIAGRAAPGATVDLMRAGERLDQAVADASGQFVMVPSHLPAGSYDLTLSARMPDGTVTLSKQGVSVTVKEADADTGSTAAGAEPARGQAMAAKPHDAISAPQQRQAMAATPATDDGGSAHRNTTATGANGGTIKVVAGDSLWRISRIAYGAGEQYALVYRANRDHIHNPNLIRPGQVLVVPLKHR